MSKQMTIAAMVEKTQDAYSFDRYGKSGWSGAVRELRRRGYNDLEVEAILRSKHMRWAGDCDDKRRYGHLNGKTVAEYLERYPMTQEHVDSLVMDTF